MSVADNILVLNNDLKEIQNCIETEAATIAQIQTVIDNMPTVVGGGYNKGYADGKQAEYERFWDSVQDNGNRTDYDQAFRSNTWNDITFNPKYPLKVEGEVGGREIFSRATTLTNIKVPVYAKNTVLNYTFYLCSNLKTIPLLNIGEGTTFSVPFRYCSALENLTIDGVIGANGFTVADSPKLTHDSLMSIINALQNHVYLWTKTEEVFEPIENYVDFEIWDMISGDLELRKGVAYTTTNEKIYWAWSEDAQTNSKNAYVCEVDGVYYICTYEENPTKYTLTLGATNLAKLTDEEKAIATEKGWTLA